MAGTPMLAQDLLCCTKSWKYPGPHILFDRACHCVWMSQVSNQVIRRPRPSPRPGRRLGPPQVWTLSSSKPSKPLPLSSFPNRHPRARATAMTFYELSNPQGQGHSNETFYEFQSCRLLARKGSKLSKTKFQTPSPTGTPGPRPLPQQAPHGQGQGHFPNRHPRARPQQWLS